MTVRVSDSTTFYSEIRWVHTNGPSFTNAAGTTITANGNYIPFTFGFRFHSGS